MTTVRLTEEKFNRLYDPVLFQGSHHGTRYYMFYSTLSWPDVNGSSKTDTPYYEGQLDISWMSENYGDGVPATDTERITRIKSIATGFHSRSQDLIEGISHDAKVVKIDLNDWPTEPWDGLGGRVTLLGDAAHPMTMCKYHRFSTPL